MTKADKIKIDKLIHSLSLKYNMSENIIKDIVYSPFLFTYRTAKDIDFKSIRSEEEFKNKKTNFLFKGLGLLYANFNRFKRSNLQKKNINKINDKKWKN